VDRPTPSSSAIPTDFSGQIYGTPTRTSRSTREAVPKTVDSGCLAGRATEITRANIPCVNGHHFRARAAPACRARRHHADEVLRDSCASKVTASCAISVRGNNCQRWRSLSIRRRRRGVSVSSATAPVARTCPTPDAWALVVTAARPNGRRLAGSYGRPMCSIEFVVDSRGDRRP
jgi:hypothetical protein